MNCKSNAKVILAIIVSRIFGASCGTFKVKGQGSFQYEAEVGDEDGSKGSYGHLIPAVQHQTLPTGELILDSRRECMLKLAFSADGVNHLRNEGLASKHLNSEEVQKPENVYLTEIFHEGNRFDFKDGEEWYYALAMQRHGIDLWEYNNQEQVPPREICIIAAEVLKQLGLCFNANTAHGDMKPTNIMVEFGAQKILKGTKIYIIDFGLATFPGSFSVNELGVGCFIFGTLNYVEGQGRTTSQDVEGLAYILKYLATRELEWFNTATKFNASRKRSTKSRQYKKILKAKKGFAKEVNKAAEIPDELKALLIDLWTVAKDGNFTAAHYQTFVQRFEACHAVLQVGV